MAAEAGDHSKFHLLAVNVAADLGEVKLQGEEVSLSAQNAKVLVARAGTAALGFRPITEFMIQLAADTIRLVREIDREALAVSRLAVTRLRTTGALHTAQHAASLAHQGGALYADQLESFVHRTREADDAIVGDLTRHSAALVRYLSEIAMLMLAARAMASSAKVEAASVPTSHRQSFLTVAEKLDDCASSIRENVGINLSLINKALQRQRNEA